MSERRVSVDRTRHQLPEPFIVLATQNPLEYVGTFPLPESQLDRFMMSLFLGYPPRDDERALLLSGGVEDELRAIEPAISRDEILDLQRRVDEISASEKLVDYILSLVQETRESADYQLGVSTRGVQSLLRASQAAALCEGRTFVIPDDVQSMAVPVLAHRVVLTGGSATLVASRDAIAGLVRRVPVPV
jgi:MoxR-like ATPase